MLKIKNKNSGFTLIEALTLLFVFSIITLSFYSVMSVGLRYIQDSKNRLAALAVANEKMEIVRNLKYDDVGTTGAGTGSLPEDEDVTENGKTFHIDTVVGYDDDDYDNNYPADVIPGDFKQVIITVLWGDAGLGGNNSVELKSRFVPPGLEVANTGDGILSINIFSDQPGGAGIPDSSVHIINNDTVLDTNQTTDSSGNVILIGPNIQDSIQKYEIIVSKNGYETVATMPPFPDTNYNPTFVHASVVSGGVNVANIVQNELADLDIDTVDYLNQPIGNIDFHLNGGKLLGIETTEPFDLIYNLVTDENTDSGGEKEFNGISPGQYEFSLLESGYRIIGIDPPFSYKLPNTGDDIYLLSLFSEPPLGIKVKLASKAVASLLVSVLKSTDKSPIFGAVVQLTNAFGYDVSQITPIDGRAFFPTTTDVFASGLYNLKITADGFSDSDSQVTIIDDQLKVETIELNAI
ncbi:MAG TPA: hypothetical protein DCS28_03300 [Candidatus Moranbacteria bacterium]|nr:hypothetical protein [Candidatus Moranbacteria bacterium]HAT75038.1 hypothetical protein [Candidatus Moranbacteria bacterium]